MRNADIPGRARAHGLPKTKPATAGSSSLLLPRFLLACFAVSTHLKCGKCNTFTTSAYMYACKAKLGLLHVRSVSCPCYLTLACSAAALLFSISYLLSLPHFPRRNRIQHVRSTAFSKVRQVDQALSGARRPHLNPLIPFSFFERCHLLYT